jgi:hypothetical protein
VRGKFIAQIIYFTKPEDDLKNVECLSLSPHFCMRWGINQDFYWATIENSIRCLQLIITDYEADLKNYLRRQVPETL